MSSFIGCSSRQECWWKTKESPAARQLQALVRRRYHPAGEPTKAEARNSEDLLSALLTGGAPVAHGTQTCPLYWIDPARVARFSLPCVWSRPVALSYDSVPTITSSREVCRASSGYCTWRRGRTMDG